MSEQWQTALALLLSFSLSHFWLFQNGLWVLDVLACKTHLDFAWCFRLLLEIICWRRHFDKMIFSLSARRCFFPTRQAHHILRNLCSRKLLPDIAHNLGSSPSTFCCKLPVSLKYVTIGRFNIDITFCMLLTDVAICYYMFAYHLLPYLIPYITMVLPKGLPTWMKFTPMLGPQVLTMSNRMWPVAFSMQPVFGAKIFHCSSLFPKQPSGEFLTCMNRMVSMK